MVKGTLYLILFTMLFLSCHKDTADNAASCNFVSYRYYKDAKDTIGELSNKYLFVAFDTTYSITDIRKFISSLSDFDQNYRYKLYNAKVAALKFSSPKTCEEITGIISSLQKNPIVAFAHYTMKTNDCQSMISTPLGNLCVFSYGSLFNVEVFNPNNLTDLYKMIAATKTELVEQNQFMPDWFTLRATKNSSGDALKMANYFYESKLFVATEPELDKLPVE